MKMNEQLEARAARARKIAEIVKPMVPKGDGFILITFPSVATVHDFISISNCQPNDMYKALREILKQQGGEITEKFKP